MTPLTKRHELLGRRRMQGYGGVEIALGEPGLHRDCNRLNDLRSVGTHHVRAEHPLIVGIDDELHQRALVAARPAMPGWMGDIVLKIQAVRHG